MVPKFILVSSATCLRFHLYANTWLFAKLVIGDCGLCLNFSFSLESRVPIPARFTDTIRIPVSDNYTLPYQ